MTELTKTPVWKSIAGSLESEIAAGHYRAGQKLPTEAALSVRFGVNRHTVRHALSDMAERGIVRSRRGAGVFVEAEPTDYPIGRRVRFHQNIRAAGGLPGKKVLRVEERACDAAEAKALNLKPGDPVTVYEGVSFVNGAPIAHVVSVFALARAPGLTKALQELTSITAALKACGIADYTRSETRIMTEAATATQALHLSIGQNDPLLKTVSINVLADGTPIEFGTTYFAGQRVALTVTAD